MNRLRYFLFILLMPLSIQAAPSSTKGLKETDAILKQADTLWTEGKMEKVTQKYAEALASLPEEGEFFRPSIILRYARALYAAGKKKAALQQLDSLNSFKYVPEHIALFAKEFRRQMEGKKEPGTERTPLPPLKKADISFFVSATATADTNDKNIFSNIHDALKAL